MLLSIDPFEVNLKSPHEVTFLEWYNNNKGKTKELILCGYFCIQYGVVEYIHNTLASTSNEREAGYRKQLEDKDAHLAQITAQMQEAIKLQVQSQLTFYQSQNTTLQENIAKQKDIYEAQIAEMKGNFQQQVQSQLAFYQHQNNTLQDNIGKQRQFYETQLSELKTCVTTDLTERYEATIADLRQQLASIKTHTVTELSDKFAKDLEIERYRILDENQRKTHEETSRIMLECERYRTLYSETRARCDTILESMNTNLAQQQLQYLKEEHDRAIQELSVLKKTNMAKGNKGEHIISSSLREHFSQCSVEDTSKVSHAGDIRMTFPDGGIIMIESKYKESGVAKSDITKFQNDVAKMASSDPSAFHGAVLVSICSRNIPSKGDMHFELWENKPVLYLGYSDQEEFAKWFPYSMQLFVNIARCQAVFFKNSNSIDDMMKCLMPLFEKLKKLKMNVNKLKANVTDLENSVTDILSDSEEICNLLNLVGVMPKKRATRKKA